VPDQHAAFGINKATRDSREPGWRDLGLAELVNGGPAAVRPSTNLQAGAGAARSAINETSVSGQQTEGHMGGSTATTVVPEGRRPGEVVVGPTRGVVGVPVGARAGLRAVNLLNGSDLRS
jgi:Apc13p protein